MFNILLNIARNNPAFKGNETHPKVHLLNDIKVNREFYTYYHPQIRLNFNLYDKKRHLRRLEIDKESYVCRLPSIFVLFMRSREVARPRALEEPSDCQSSEATCISIIHLSRNCPLLMNVRI